MAVLRERPYTNNNFQVDLGDGEIQGPEHGYLEIVLPEGITQVVEYRSGNEREGNARKITALTKYGNITLKRGMIGSLNLYQWWNQVRNGDQAALRTVTIHILSEELQVVLSVRLLRARPVKYSLGTLNAVDSAIFTETVELAFERLEIE